MKIRMLFEHGYKTESPWLVVAVDEYTEEEHGKTPEFYQEELDQNSQVRRELIVEIPDGVVHRLFQTPVISAMAAYPPPEKEDAK